MRAASFALLLALVAGCGDEAPRAEAERPPAAEPTPAPPRTSLPERASFDQILIAFEGSYERADIHRSREAAGRLARTLFERLQSGADFEVLKQEYSDDRGHGVALGPYVAVRADITPVPPEMLPAAGLAAVLFGLRPGEVGFVEYDPARCPNGWFLIKRLG